MSFSVSRRSNDEGNIPAFRDLANESVKVCTTPFNVKRDRIF